MITLFKIVDILEKKTMCQLFPMTNLSFKILHYQAFVIHVLISLLERHCEKAQEKQAWAQCKIWTSLDLLQNLDKLQNLFIQFETLKKAECVTSKMLNKKLILSRWAPGG